MTAWVADYTNRIAPADLKAAGVVGVCRYLADSTSIGKIITKAEYDELRAADLDVILNWEQRADDWLGGAASGARHAASAVRQAKALGYPPGSAIPGSADFDMRLSQWNSAGRAYAVAFRDGIRAGGYVPGVYGPWDVLTWCQQLGGFELFWQCMSTAFSSGRNRNPWPGAHLRQRRYATVGGHDVDYNDILRDDWQGDDMDLNTQLTTGITINNALVTLLARTDYLANKIGLADQLTKILAAASASPSVPVELTEAQQAALAEHIAGLLHVPTAEDLTGAVKTALVEGVGRA